MKRRTVTIVDDEVTDWMDSPAVEQEEEEYSAGLNELQKPSVPQQQEQLSKWKSIGKERRDLSPPRKQQKTSGNGEPQEKKTVYRDIKGRIVNIEEEQVKRKQEEDEIWRKKEEQRIRNLGTKQKAYAKERLREEESVKHQPMNRYADDKDINRRLKERQHWEDPVAANQTATSSGQKSSANRFGIMAGKHWDGVDRSNGFETKWFRQQRQKQAQEEERYKWRTEDM